MKRWQIENTVSGLILGVYEGETEAEALDALARDAGYADNAAAMAAIESDGSDIRVAEVE